MTLGMPVRYAGFVGKRTDAIGRLKLLNILLNEIYCYFNCWAKEDYKPQEIKILWKLSGLTVDEVSQSLFRSHDRCLQYCYGQNMSREKRVEVARFFKSVIYVNNIVNE